MSARLLRGILALNAVAQLAAGGLGFALAPERVIGAPLDEAARLGFRLAGLTNGATALFTAYAVARLPVPDLRALAACLAGYHALAGAEALRHLTAGDALAAVGASAGPFHALSAALLAGAALAVGRAATPSPPHP